PDDPGRAGPREPARRRGADRPQLRHHRRVDPAPGGARGGGDRRVGPRPQSLGGRDRRVLVVRRQKGGRAQPAGPGDPPAAEEKGERWGAMSVERASRFVVAWASGPRDERLAQVIVTKTRDRTRASGQTN